VHVFYEAESGDANKKFQFFCQGIEYQYVSGRYATNEEGKNEEFEVQLPQWSNTLVRFGLVSIYRKGVKEFMGVLTTPRRTLSDAPRVTVRGPDIGFLLEDRVAETEIYSAKTPQYIIEDLLTKYPCGITKGTLNSYPDTITITLDTEDLRKALRRICDAVAWNFRINLDRTLDFAESFGAGQSAATFTEGLNIVGELDYPEKCTGVRTRIRMKGSGITSTKEDPAAIQQWGLHEGEAFQKSISNQATLDLACAAYLELMKTEDRPIRARVKDDDQPSYGAEDLVWVEAPSVGLSEFLAVKRIEREMIDPNVAILELSNRTREYWELDNAYRRMVKDVSV